MNSKKTGVLGEKIALEYLESKGYEILDKNYVPKFSSGPQTGEIDIIVRRRKNILDFLFGKKDDSICFIEVKALRNSNPAVLPEDKVNFQKKKKLIKTAQNWLMEKEIPLNVKWQIDVISVRINPVSEKAKISHFENAIDTNY